MVEMMITVPSGVVSGQIIKINTSSGPMQVTVPNGVGEGQQFRAQLPAAPSGVVVDAQNAGYAPGAFHGGPIAAIGDASNKVSNAMGGPFIGKGKAKQSGDGVMVSCLACGAENRTKMAMGSRAQFNCGQCGQVVLWRPRQVWLRDQGMYAYAPPRRQPPLPASAQRHPRASATARQPTHPPTHPPTYTY